MSTENQESLDLMSEGKVLILDKLQDRAEKLSTVLSFIDYIPVIIKDPKQLKKTLEDGPFIAVIIGDEGDIQQQNRLLANIRQYDSIIPVFYLIERDRDDVHSGELRDVLGYIEVPFHYGNLANALDQAILYLHTRENKSRRRALELFRSLVGSSRRVNEIRRMIEQVAPTEATVLILGESGTGKEVVARNIHYQSVRREAPFVPINCGAIPHELLESELFGHEKGAFTGAISARQGRFEMAEGGTLFLDEIGDMPLPMQVKLLRVLQEKTFERVGSNKSITTDVRIIAATHRDLEEHIKEGNFREDLYYRLNVFPIEMPPLRDRIEDIPMLSTELITRIEHEKRGSVRLTPAAVMALCQYKWPGNVRELANLMERLAILYPFGVVDVKDLPDKFRGDLSSITPVYTEMPEIVMPAISEAPDSRLPREGINLKEHLSNMEVSLIRQALDEADGVVAHAAKLLNMRRTTLVEKLRKYGIQSTSGN